MYPALPKSYKGAYPFKLGTTSFTYPAGYLENVKMLGPYLDEIELLLFESAPESLPTRPEIREIGRMGKVFDLSYNIHLPLDISMGSPDSSRRQYAIKTIRQTIERTAPLSPSTCTLHLPYDGNGIESESIQRWQERLYNSTRQLAASGIEPESISIETLNYPLEWVEMILNDFNFSVCIDLGHLLVNRFDMNAVFERYGSRTAIIHLHGVANQKDHLPLNRLPQTDMDAILKILKRFKGIVSLEVFSYDHLTASLQFLEESWQKGTSLAF